MRRVLNTASRAVLRGFKAIVPVDTLDGALQEQIVIWQIANGSTLWEEPPVTHPDLITRR